MILPFSDAYRKDLVQMMREFYHSPAVLSPVPDEHFDRTVNLVCQGTPFAAGHIMLQDEKPAGYALLAFTYSNEAGGMVLWLEEFYVRPDFRGKGLGTEYFQYLFREYDGKIARMRLEIEPENEKALRLYERMGLEKLPYEQLYREFEK